MFARDSELSLAKNFAAFIMINSSGGQLKTQQSLGQTIKTLVHNYTSTVALYPASTQACG